MTPSRVAGRLVGRIGDRLTSRDLLLAGGTLSFLLAVLVAVLPAAYVPGVVTWAAGTLLANRTTVVLAGIVAGGFGVWSLYRGTDADDGQSVEFPTRPPEFAYYDERRAVGQDIDRAVGDEEFADWEHGRHRRETKNRLHDAAVSALVETENCAPQIARNRVAEGTWTDSPRAARFLGGPDAADLPLSVRIRDWASGESYRKHVEDTVQAVTDLEGGESR